MLRGGSGRRGFGGRGGGSVVVVVGVDIVVGVVQAAGDDERGGGERVTSKRADQNATTVRGAIQTDAKVPETAAGGALLDSGGRLIGLTVTPYGKGQAGVGFAVAVDDLMQVVPSLITLRQIS